jgi:hypothetical protein
LLTAPLALTLIGPAGPPPPGGVAGQSGITVSAVLAKSLAGYAAIPSAANTVRRVTIICFLAIYL